MRMGCAMLYFPLITFLNAYTKMNKILLIIAASAACFFISPKKLNAQTWDGGAGTTSWMDAANWSGDVLPTATSTVNIGNGVTVVVPSGTALAKVIANNGNLTVQSGATLTVTDSNSGGFTFNNGAGSLTNEGTINVSAGSGTLSGLLFQAGVSFLNNGTINLNNIGRRALTFSGGSATNNGTINISNTGLNSSSLGDAFLFNAGGTFTNTGTITMSGSITANGFLNNSGTIINNSGSITIVAAGNGITAGGTFNNTGSGTVSFGTVGGTEIAANVTFNQSSSGTVTTTGVINCAGTFKGNGTGGVGAFANTNITAPGASAGCLTFSDSYTSSGTVQIEINGTTPCTQFDQINATGAATLSGTLTITWGGTPTVGSYTIMTFGSRSGTFTTVTIPPVSGLQFTTSYTATAVIINVEVKTYTFNGTTNSDWATASNWSTGTVPTSAGILSGESVVINANCNMSNVAFSMPTGTSLTVNSTKTLALSGSAAITLQSGVTSTVNGILDLGVAGATNFTVNSGASLSVSSTGSISQGRIVNSGTVNTSGSYTAFYFTNNSGGILNVLSGGSYSCPSCAETFSAGSTLNNDGTLNVGTANTWQCTVNNNATGTITDGGNGTQVVFGSSSVVNNYGSFVSRTSSTAGTFNNYSTGVLSMPATCNFTVQSGGNFTNQGNINADNNSNTLTISSGGSLTNANIITMNGEFSVSGTFTNNGTLKGTGNYTGSLSNPAAGIVAPGNSPGCLSVSGGFSNAGTVQIELGGTTACTQYDQITVTGAATLGGALSVSLINGYSGLGSDQVTILQAAAISGTFASASLPANWYLNYTSTSIILSFGALLPVEMTAFTARPVGNSVRLDWQTAVERNNKGFYIERMYDDRGRWVEIGFVEGNGTTTDTHNYSFMDEKPLPGMNYYRLRQMDVDGGAELSKVVSVDFGSHQDFGNLSIFPNPVTNGELHILLPADIEQGIRMDLYNTSGQMLHSAMLSPEINSIDLSDLPKGVYMMKLSSESKVAMEKIMVVK